MSARAALSLQVNGAAVDRDVEPRLTLADFLRNELKLTGTHLGCEHGVCGACTVLVDGEAVRSCLLFAVQAQGRSITTVEGLAQGADLHPLQRALLERNGLQCGFCTPGVLMTAMEFLENTSVPTREEIRKALSGTICRCTGYQGMVDAIAEIAGGDR
ncbi:MAG: (2Fe-2S)-binding protein [Chloroflexi bacterium]|nr:(2Fe-2S)-binding protein [Chloroflexota bacterium]